MEANLGSAEQKSHKAMLNELDKELERSHLISAGRRCIASMMDRLTTPKYSGDLVNTEVILCENAPSEYAGISCAMECHREC